MLKFLVVGFLALVNADNPICNVRIAFVKPESGKRLQLLNFDGRCRGKTCGSAGAGVSLVASNVPEDTNNDTKDGIELNNPVWGRINYCAKIPDCKRLFGNNANGCRYATVNKVYWVPRPDSGFCTANLSALNRTQIRENLIFYREFKYVAGVACCDTDRCNSYYNLTDPNRCTKDTDLSRFLTDGNKCWDITRARIFRRFHCNAFGIKNRQWRETAGCRSTTFKYQKTKCRYRRTCTKAVREILRKFGNCVCEAAVEHNTTRFGGKTEDYFEEIWKNYCPKIQLKCEDDTTSSNYGKLVFRTPFRRYKWRLRLKRRWSQLTPEQRKAILKKIADYLFVEEDEIEAKENTDASRRRLQDGDSVDITVETDGEELKQNLNINDPDVETTLPACVSSNNESSIAEDGSVIDNTPCDYDDSASSITLFFTFIIATLAVVFV